MATKLNKRVVRECVATFGRASGKMRVIMAALEPGDLLVFWDKGTRTRYELPIGAARDLAVKMAANQLRKERAERRKAKKG